MAEIAFRNVAKSYAGERAVIKNLDLDVRDGEFLVLVGPSGSGKSTALRIVAGLEDVTDGHVSIGGQDVTHTAPKDRDIAMVFQNYALYPHMTVAQNMSFALELAKVPAKERERRVAEAATLLGLGPYLKRKPSQLSGGQRQRVAMGRAIVREPRAFLMDEPLSNLDAKLRVSMRSAIAALHEKLGVTTIYVTHDQVEAMTLGQRVAVLHEGELQQVDTPQRLYDAPVNLFVAGFIGSPAMNLVEARLVQDDGLSLQFGHFRIPAPAGLLDKFEGLAAFIGKSVILGLRPHSFEDAQFTSDAFRPRIAVLARATESLGSEVNVIFEVDAPAIVSAGQSVALSSLEKEVEEERELVTGAADRSVWTARVNAKTGIRPGCAAIFTVDLDAAHFFDPSSGLAVRRL
jgi:multiple sugar transport system ATP-binding protein